MVGCQNENRSLVLRRGMADSVRFMGIRQRLGQSDSPIGHGREHFGLEQEGNRETAWEYQESLI